jgi:hypothetical protein
MLTNDEVRKTEMKETINVSHRSGQADDDDERKSEQKYCQ